MADSSTAAGGHAAIALNRFGLGARPDDAPPARPREALLAQFDSYLPAPPAWTGLPESATLAAAWFADQRALRDMDEMARRDARQRQQRDARAGYLAAVQARTLNALETPAPFVERLVFFWANHFALSVEKPEVLALAGSFEAEAIRPHVLGRFGDLLLAAERHPAMLLYLDQLRSLGPNSPAAVRSARNNPQLRRGLNENLAREILELHTLGVRSGYTQQDVTEFAGALTGWGIAGAIPQQAAAQQAAGPDGFFSFYPAQHEPGSRTIVGRRYDLPGEAQAAAVLRDLAAAPATARHIATKLARHFVADDPPPAVVMRLETAFLRSGGDLPTVYRALLDAPEAWSPRSAKFKTPWEWTLSSLRGLGQRELRGVQAAQLLNQLGQPVWRPGSPAGWDDIAASWAAPDALLRRVELAQRLVSRAADRRDPRELAGRLLPGALSEATALAVSRAESPAAGTALLLVSPEFLRR